MVRLLVVILRLSVQGLYFFLMGGGLVNFYVWLAENAILECVTEHSQNAVNVMPIIIRMLEPLT